MRFSGQILDDIRARLPVSQVVGRRVALKKKGREFAGLSPFKTEKTASFFVNDQKGFYHCFASGEHGDIFTFVMKTEGLSFPEAVERLATEAGVSLPKEGPRDERREDERTRLYAAMEAAARFFEQSLGGAGEARRYLDKRGLTQNAIQKFRLGYAPNSRSALRQHLAGAGFTPQEMIAAGLLIAGEDIPAPYDRFRHRVIFPITDLKGRTIAFGGRALDADQPAKYLNSPETPLFHKGANLYNAANARGPAHERGRVIAVEGYMDTIALVEAGFPETVAPLGTALTEDQVKLLWRLAPEPILCFDGDGAGRKAAFRAVDTVLPHLAPGRSVAFAFLPGGLDPDDLVRQQGAAAMEPILARVRSLADVLWEREWSGGDWATPERRARLEAGLRALVARIGDADVRRHYDRDVRDRLFKAWRPAPGGKTAPGGNAPFRGPGAAPRRDGFGKSGRFSAAKPEPVQAGSSLKNSAMVTGAAAAPPREALLLRVLLAHPWLVADYAEDIARLELTSLPLSHLRDAILATHAGDNSLDSARLRSQLSIAGLDGALILVERTDTHGCDRFARPDAEHAEVDIGWRHVLALHMGQVGHEQPLEAAERAWRDECDEGAFARIREIQRERVRSNGAGDLNATDKDPFD